jgi:hypothetical protein
MFNILLFIIGTFLCIMDIYHVWTLKCDFFIDLSFSYYYLCHLDLNFLSGFIKPILQATFIVKMNEMCEPYTM